MKCRHCHSELKHRFVNLGMAPPSNAYLTGEQLQAPETFYPLKVMVCTRCWLVQTEDYVKADELFTSDYVYFSSTSRMLLEHAYRYFEMITKKLKLTPNSFVIEIASNDGYLLKHFVANKIPCLGIEPAKNTAQVARKFGIPVMEEFFSAELATKLAKQGKMADLVCGNNVYAHVPDINDFTEGLRIILNPGGTVTLEFPHLMQIIEHTQFDTIYHEHFSYLSIGAAAKIFSSAGLKIVDVDQITTHGGSLRLYGCHADDPRNPSRKVESLLKEEEAYGLNSLSTYESFQSRVENIKYNALSFLIEQKRAGKKVAAYGAAAKGTTLLNYAGIRTDLIEYVCDGARAKQGKYLPGCHVPVVAPKQLKEPAPDWIVIFPWNIADEIRRQLSHLPDRTRFVTFVPEVNVW